MAGYNERAWAVDVIAEINRIVGHQNLPIRRAGGEYSVKEGKRHLFPDVLLFKDPQGAVILQGWELKFPDTDIHDDELFENASRKANVLGLDSFLLWNVTCAELYRRNNNGFSRTPIFHWDDLSKIRNRNQVKQSEVQWKALLAKIITELNDRFTRGEIEGRPFIEAYRSGGVVEMVLANQSLLSESLEKHFSRDSILESKILLWWESIKDEYSAGYNKPSPALARFILINWISKFLLAHILMRRDSRIHSILNDNALKSPQKALKAFSKLSKLCDFWTVFYSFPAQEYTNALSWAQLRELHHLLNDLRIGGIDQEQLLALLEETVDIEYRKLKGQYATPVPLAQLLVRLALDDKSGVIGDFCCGTGTIPCEALKIKREYGIANNNVVKQVWANDRYREPLQLSALAMASNATMGSVLQVFCEDAFLLNTNYTAVLHDPHDGSEVRRKLSELDAIASNLPFISQKGRSSYLPQIEQVNSWLKNNKMQPLSPKADVAAYLPFVLCGLLRSGGRMSIIITASWIDTDWTKKFRDALLQCFKIKAVVVSGCGRWFQKAKVVTHILLLEKRGVFTKPDSLEQIHFCVTRQTLKDIENTESNKSVTAGILAGRGLSDQVEVRTQRYDRLRQITDLGIGWNAQFVDCDWVLDLPFAKLNKFFKIGRGERRGWNDMFYPNKGHGIEKEYLTPLLKSPSEISGYLTKPTRFAFTCGESIKSLGQKKRSGALAWIRKFENQTNTEGCLLPKALARAHHHWYEMKPDTMADLVIPIDFGDRLFVPRIKKRCFVDQRLSYLRALGGTDVNFCHALLNSVVSYFWLEGMGFGRGLGALDLNSDKFKNRMRILDPSCLNQDQRNDIIKLFSLVQNRDVMSLPDELESPDRVAFDQGLLAMYGFEQHYERIKTALLSLYAIRKASVDD